MRHSLFAVPLIAIAMTASAADPSGEIGIFTASADVGKVDHPGSAKFDPAAKTYTVTGSGTNMWFNTDAFQFLSKKVSGDVSLTTDVDWVTPGVEAHRKAGPIFRAGLAADDPYADLVAHGAGLIALQYRLVKGGPTLEVQTTIVAPATLRLERTGNVISAEVVPKGGGIFHPIGALSVPLPEIIYAGLAVCSHNNDVNETARFSNVVLRNDGVVQDSARVVESTLEVVDIDSGQRRIIRRAQEHFEAPNWSHDGATIFYNGDGKLYRIPADGGNPTVIDTGNVALNNDHGLSPDGKSFGISGTPGRGPSQIWIVPVEGGEPKLLVKAQPSYWHGWSPDGKTIAYCAERNNNFDIYTIPVAGGDERRLTTADGLDDGPDYTPDGQWIYFNSERTGLMQIWRMHGDGSQQEQVSRGTPMADWFAHPSPDGQWIAYVSFDKSVQGHPPNKDVVIRLMPIAGGEPKALVTLFGGQGTMNVPSWSPDSKHFAFVSYRLVPAKAK